MNCCSKCFNDKVLESHIEKLATKTGRCDFCYTEGVRLVEPAKLADRFMIFLDAYKESPNNGSPISELLKQDWGLFSAVGEKELTLLLPQLFDDPYIISKKFEPLMAKTSEYTSHWDDFCEELKYRNRFFPSKLPDLEDLKGLMSFYLENDSAKLPQYLYRARIEEPSTILDIRDMGKPPASKTTNGRANPIGIPYLYLASDIETAISEVRPNTGQMVAVASFTKAKNQNKTNARIIDLCNPRQRASPFEQEQADRIVALRYELDFLRHLSDELSMPVVPDTANLSYLPSQYICEFIKHMGYIGLEYRSAAGDGINYALFDDDLFVPVEITRYRVSRVGIKYEKCP